MAHERRYLRDEDRGHSDRGRPLHRRDLTDRSARRAHQPRGVLPFDGGPADGLAGERQRQGAYHRSDGTDVWVGGYFTQLAGQARGHIAKLDAATGALDDSFAPNLNNNVRGLEVAEGSVVAGGTFARVNGVGGHLHIVKLDGETGAVDPQFMASASRAVLTMVKAPTSNVIYIGGRFDFVNGIAREGVSGLDFTTGAVVGPPMLGSQLADVRARHRPGRLAALRRAGQQHLHRLAHVERHPRWGLRTMATCRP